MMPSRSTPEVMEERDLLRNKTLESLREKIERGLASLDRGEGVSAEEVFAEIEAGLERRARRVFGVDRGRFEIPEDFDARLPEEVLRSFEG